MSSSLIPAVVYQDVLLNPFDREWRYERRTEPRVGMANEEDEEDEEGALLKGKELEEMEG